MLHSPPSKMVFTVQPSKKKKATIGYRHKKGGTYAAHQDSLAAGTVNPLPPGVEPPDGVSAASSIPVPKKRKDNNWRVARAVKRAKNQAARAVAARDRAREEASASKSNTRAAKASVKEVEHQLYLEKKNSRATAIKTEEEHKVQVDALVEKFGTELECAHAETRLETNKRLQEEALRILSNNKHSQELRKDRQYHADKMAAKKSKAERDSSAHAATIDFLHKKWKEKMVDNMAAMTLRHEERMAKETTKWRRKLEKYEKKMKSCVTANEDRSVHAVISLLTSHLTTNETNIEHAISSCYHTGCPRYNSGWT